MKCLRCGNEDKRYFYKDKDTYYCRKCIHFGRVNVGSLPKQVVYKKPHKLCKVDLDYTLTRHQKRCVRELRASVYGEQEVLVFAACGAGKTEIVMDSIMRYVNEGKKVGFAIARRQVVLEIKDRLQDAFKNLHIVAVCEGYTTQVDGDVIVCTMHQLYRYYKTFDLLIMDEIDAFPYAGNVMLENIAKLSCTGAFLYLSATPDDALLKRVQKGEVKKVELFVRPHGFPLIEPRMIIVPRWVQIFVAVYLYIKHKVQTLLFVPTIKDAKRYASILWFLRPKVMTSKSKQKEAIMTAFRKQAFSLLICTTVLERGITIHQVNVIILHSEHKVFQSASLMQMVGRVGRKKTNPFGCAYYIGNTRSKAMRESLHIIKEMNKDVI
ncbi:MAG: helicase-related protein [Breznakia sp.]